MKCVLNERVRQIGRLKIFILLIDIDNLNYYIYFCFWVLLIMLQESISIKTQLHAWLSKCVAQE